MKTLKCNSYVLFSNSNFLNTWWRFRRASPPALTSSGRHLGLCRPRRKHGRIDGQRTFPEVVVLQSLVASNPLLWVVGQEPPEQRQSGIGDHPVREFRSEVGGRDFGKSHFLNDWKLAVAGPDFFTRRSWNKKSKQKFKTRLSLTSLLSFRC